MFVPTDGFTIHHDFFPAAIFVQYGRASRLHTLFCGPLFLFATDPAVLGPFVVLGTFGQSVLSATVSQLFTVTNSDEQRHSDVALLD